MMTHDKNAQFSSYDSYRSRVSRLSAKGKLDGAKREGLGWDWMTFTAHTIGTGSLSTLVICKSICAELLCARYIETEYLIEAQL